MFAIDQAANFATFGGVTEGNPSFWLEQMVKLWTWTLVHR